VNLDLKEENERLKQSVDAPFEIVGKTPVMRALMEKIEKVAATPARVLITGENGTGKELVARALHRLSSRAKQPFVEVNCAAIPGELIESELFGHMKGSFTGAVTDRAGKFEQSNTRTLTSDALERLTSLDWPGNVRELRNTVERLLILAPNTEISARDIDRLAGQRVMDDAGLASLSQCKTFEEFKDAAERAFLLNKL